MLNGQRQREWKLMAGCCCGKPCCGRTNLPATLYATFTKTDNCNCTGWLGLTIPMTRGFWFPETEGLVNWGASIIGPCTVINGVETAQRFAIKLECTKGPIGQTGIPSDLILYTGDCGGNNSMPPCDPNDPVEQLAANNTASIFPTRSQCSPLVLVYSVAAFEPRCQDPMSPLGPLDVEITITE